MLRSQDPAPDSWYVNETGKVLKVRLLLYREGNLTAVIVESLDGQRKSIELESWYDMRMSRYCCSVKNLLR